MAYINAFVSHFRAVQEWGQRADASIQLDVATFQLEVKCRHRYYAFHPQFVTAADGLFANTATLTPATGGFAGWLPYRPLSYPLSQDKLQFKKLVAGAGLKTPATWDVGEAGPIPDQDYILKRSTGSYGNELSGPFKAGAAPSEQPQPRSQPKGALFAEQYVDGVALKAWCWGARSVFAHCQPAKTVQADGSTTARQLVESRLAQSGQSLETYSEAHVLRDCLAYQGLALDDVPPAGMRVLFDYRYGREASPRGLRSDNALPELKQTVKDQIARAGALLANELRSVLAAPILFSLDGVIDAHDQVWWLEINSNPTTPPDAYAPMFSDLFGA